MKLIKKYGHKLILLEEHFDLPQSGIIGLVGPNGVGKTTLLKMLAGIRKPTKGEIEISKSAINPDINDLYDFKLIDLGTLYQSFFNDFDLNKYKEIITDNNLKLNDHYSNLSKGQKTLVSIALTFSRDVGIYLLDEPFSGLDIIVRKRIVEGVIKHIDTSQKLIIISSHDIYHLERLIDSVLIIKNKRLLLYPLEEINQPLVDWYKQII